MIWKLCLVTIGIVLGARLVQAQVSELSKRKIQAVRVTAPPVIDGKLDDACWKTLPQATGFSDSLHGSLVKDQTTVWIGYDDENIYVAFDCRESQPTRIAAHETKRGANLGNDDYVFVVINPFNTKRGQDESWFDVNPLGTQFTRMAEGRANKQEWEGEWRSAAQITKGGWTVEMAVPWKVLGRPRTGGKPVNVDINFGRIQVWSSVYSCWSYTTVQGKPELTGEWQGVCMPDGGSGSSLSALWYGYAGFEHDKPLGKAGLDFRYGIDPRQTALLTINPDFGNVEGAVTSIDFSYAEKLAAETRPFFMEGASFFSDVAAGSFQSIRIPDIDMGAKYFGRPAPGLAAGVLTTHSIDGERTDAVAEVVKRFSPFESLGVSAVTLREPGVDNTVIGLSGSNRKGNFEVDGTYAASSDRTGNGNSGYLAASWQAGPGVAYFEHLFTSPGYMPRDGYVSFTDQRGFYGGAGYMPQWRSGPFRDLGCLVTASRTFHYDDSLFTEGLTASLSATTRNQWSLSCEADSNTFEQNRDHMLYVGVGYPASDSNRCFKVTGGLGRQDGTDYNSIDGMANWRFSKRLMVGDTTQIINMGGLQTQHIVTLSYDLSKDQAIGGRLVVRDNTANWYLSYRKSGYKGTEYYVIIGDPNAERFQTRLVLKVVGVL